MSVCERNDGWGRVMFCAAMAIVPFSVIGYAHGRVQHFVLGFAAGLFGTCLLGFLWKRTFRRR